MAYGDAATGGASAERLMLDASDEICARKLSMSSRVAAGALCGRAGACELVGV